MSMRATGIVRRVDDLGRIVIPKETRRALGVAEGDAMEIFTDGEKVILTKYQPGCHFCGSVVDDLVYQAGKAVCTECIVKLQKQAKLDAATSKR